MAAGLAAAVAMAGCSKSTTAGTGSGTPTSGSSPTTLASTPNPAVSGLAAEFEQLIAKGQTGENATFKAVYSVTTPTKGTAENLTFEQKLPDQLIEVAGVGSFISSGSGTYFCLTSGTALCYSAGSSNPLAAIFSLADPKAVIRALQSAQGQAAANAAGYKITMGNGTYGGTSGTCATITGQGNTVNVKYCFNSDGVVSYESAGGSTLTLTSYTTSVSSSDFTLPAPVTSLPAGIP